MCAWKMKIDGKAALQGCELGLSIYPIKTILGTNYVGVVYFEVRSIPSLYPWLNMHFKNV